MTARYETLKLKVQLELMRHKLAKVKHQKALESFGSKATNDQLWKLNQLCSHLGREPYNKIKTCLGISLKPGTELSYKQADMIEKACIKLIRGM